MNIRDNMIGVLEHRGNTVALIWDGRAIRLWVSDGQGRYRCYNDLESYDKMADAALCHALDAKPHEWVEGPRWCDASRKWARIVAMNTRSHKDVVLV